VQRDEFLLYDHDHDGRVGPREFMARYDDVVSKTGAFRLPKPRDDDARVEPRSAEQLRTAFDANADGALDDGELRELLADYGKADVAPELLLEKVDLDRDGRVGGAELFQMSRLVSLAFVLPTPSESGAKRATSADELFGAEAERETRVGDVPGPPWIPGPATHFRRLDLDGDGYITAKELLELQGSQVLGVRVGAVLAGLDDDEDGRIDKREFLTALSLTRQ
jgi:Ca2+-binding EF-hand superfamily protein